jgi:hypothetical protein
MRRLSLTLSLATLLMFLAASASTAVGIDHAASQVSKKSVTLSLTGIPTGQRAAVCIYSDSTCTQRVGTIGPIEQSGAAVVIVAIPAGSSDNFAQGDRIRVEVGSETSCGKINIVPPTLPTVGGTESTPCGGVCETCEVRPVPTLSQWGLISLLVLILASGVIVAMRKRTAVA